MSTGLRVEHRLLRAMADGPKNKIELRRALGWSLLGQQKALDQILQRMRVAGLVAPQGTNLWGLAPDTQVCDTCHGRGVRKTAE